MENTVIKNDVVDLGEYSIILDVESVHVPAKTLHKAVGTTIEGVVKTRYGTTAKIAEECLLACFPKRPVKVEASGPFGNSTAPMG